MKMFKLTNKAGYSATYIAIDVDTAIALAVKSGHARKPENLKSSTVASPNADQQKLLDVCDEKQIQGCLVTQLIGGVSTPVVGGTKVNECEKAYGSPPVSNGADLISILKGTIAG
jgi:hypothetical protein